MSEKEQSNPNLVEDIENECSAEDEGGLSAPIVEVPVPEVEFQSRYWFYCREWKLGRLAVEDVYLAVIEEASNALCPQPTDPVFIAKTEDENGAYYWKVVDVEDGWALCQSFDGSDEEDQIEISELRPVYTTEEDRSIAEERALTIDMYKFYNDYIFRQWDRFDESPKTTPFEPILRRRLNLCALMSEECVPRHAYYRYNRQRLEFGKAFDELTHIHGVLQQVQARLRTQPDDEKIRNEEEKFYENVYNEYLYNYSVWKVHAERLEALEDGLWQEYQITKKGRTPIVRRKNGLRDHAENKIVHHLVASSLSVKQISNLCLPDDAIIKTYGENELSEALSNCYEDDEVILFPGVYDLEEYLFHESITIRGCGESADQVVILAEDDECNFIFVDAEKIWFKNLTFEARRNTEGCVVVNGGQCVLDNCILNCDEVTRGLIVYPYAACQVQSTSINGAHESSVVIEPAGTLVDGGHNEFANPPKLNQLKEPAVIKEPLADTRLYHLGDKKIEKKVSSPRSSDPVAAGDTFAL